MRVCCISDLHGWVPPDLPGCDLLLVAGDIGPDADAAARAFLRDWFDPWLHRQDAGRVVGIAGNHDFAARRDPELMRALAWDYLEDEVVDVDGLRIAGTPWTPVFGDWTFQKPEEELAQLWSATVPADTNVLLVHGPPAGHVDRTLTGTQAGSVALGELLRRLEQLQLVVCGHIHEAYGRDTLPTGATIVNVSAVNERYELVNAPVVLEL